MTTGDLTRVVALALVATVSAAARPALATPPVRPQGQDTVRRIPTLPVTVRPAAQDTAGGDAAVAVPIEAAARAVRGAAQDTAAAVQRPPIDRIVLPQGFLERFVRPQLLVPETQLDLRVTRDSVLVPYRYASRSERTGRRLDVSPIVHIQAGGLRYDPATDEFRGSLSVILQDAERPVAHEPLDRGIWLQLISDAGPVVPDTLQLVYAGRPPRHVELRSRSPSDTVRVRVFGDPGEPPAEIPVPVHRPLIELDVPDRPHGFGFEAAAVTVHMPRDFGREPRLVTLHPSAGTVVPETLRLAGGDDGRARWRSRGVGRATIHASSAGFESPPESVVFVWPLPFLIASILGALLGSGAAIVRAGRQHERVVVGKAVGDGFGGFAAGIVTSVAFAIGINLTGFDIQVAYGEAAAFVLAALGAIYGLPGSRGRKRPASNDDPHG